MYCYDKKNTHKHVYASTPMQFKSALDKKNKLVPDITNFQHDHTVHPEFTNTTIEEQILGSVGWKIPFSSAWKRYYKFQPNDNDYISFSVSGNTATVHHAGPFGDTTVAQL